MGYEFHITRKAHWSDDEGPKIELEEWLRYVKSDPEMRLDGFAEAQLPDGSNIRIDDPGIAVWLAFSGHQLNGNMAWFSQCEDRVSVKNANTEILRKMHRIAQHFGAKLQGDEGEEYDENGELNPHSRVDADASRVRKSLRPWWKFWR